MGTVALEREDVPRRTVAQKMGVKPGWRAYVVGAPEGVMDSLGLPDLDVESELDGEFDYVHLFVRTQDEMRHRFPTLVPHLAAAGSCGSRGPRVASWVPTSPCPP